jgi:hypothetical protein
MSSLRRLGLTIERQGHIHIEIVHLVAKRRGLRKWYIQTEQKRPGGFTSYSFTLGGGSEKHEDHDLFLTARDWETTTTLFWRDGEDGSESTVLGVHLPNFWGSKRVWNTHVEYDKWGVFLVATLDRAPGHWGKRRRSWWAA